MYHESRIKKTFLNVRINMVCYFVNLIIAFFSRKIFIDYLGAAFLGLQDTLNGLMGFLNIAELGVGSAIGYVLYQPIFDGNKFKINEIISVLGYLYRWIGSVILLSGFILSCFLPIIFPHTPFKIGIIYLGFYAYLFSTVLGYFANYKSMLLSADQRNYEVTGFFQLVQVIKTCIQMACAYFITSFVLYFSIELAFSLVFSIILNYRVRVIYPWLNSEIRLGKSLLKKYPEISKYIKQLFVHCISGFVQFQLTPILIYGYVSLQMVAMYNNYTTLSNKLFNFINAILGSTYAGVGNLISEGNVQKTYELYKELFSIRFYIAGVLSLCVYYLSSDFIKIWLGNQYVLNPLVVFLVALIFFLSIVRSVNDQFINGFGLFYDVWAPLTEIIIFVLSSILFGHFYSLIGVLMGPILSLIIIVYVWKPYFLFSKGFHLNVGKYWKMFLINLALTLATYYIAAALVSYLFAYNITNWGQWISKAFTFFMLTSCISLVLYYYFSYGMRGFISRILSVRKI